MDTINTIVKETDQILKPVFNKYVLAILLVLFGLYAPLCLPQPCDNTKTYLQHPIAQSVALALTVYTLTQNTLVSAGVAGAFFGVSYLARGRKLETFQGPKTMIYPGCMNITVFDLLDSFGNDKDALLLAMLKTKIPADVKLTDDFSPLIATYLMSFGYKIKSPCQPPGAGMNPKMTSF